MADAAILDFKNLKILTVGQLKRAELRRHPWIIKNFKILTARRLKSVELRRIAKFS